MDPVRKSQLPLQRQAVFQLRAPARTDQVDVGILQQLHGLEHHFVVLVFGQLRNGQEHKVILPQAQACPDGTAAAGAVPEPLQRNPYAFDVFQTLGVHVLLGKGKVLPVDVDEQIGKERGNPLSGEEQQPVFQGSALEKVVAVGGVDDLGAPFPGVQGGKPGEEGGHGSMAVDDVIVSCVNLLFEGPIGAQVAFCHRGPAEINGIIVVAVGDEGLLIRFKIIFPGYCGFPAQLLHHFEIGNMKFQNVGFYHRCHKEYFFCQREPPP